MITLNYQLDDFSAAHRLVKGYIGPCAHLHGHNYQVTVELNAAQLQEYDMLVDFSDIKKLANKWVKDNLDHGTLVSTADPELLQFLQHNKQKHYIFPGDENTTVECLSRVIFNELQKLMNEHPSFSNVKLVTVTVHESKRACAAYSCSQN